MFLFLKMITRLIYYFFQFLLLFVWLLNCCPTWLSNSDMIFSVFLSFFFFPGRITENSLHVIFSFASFDLFSCRLSSAFYFLLQNDLCQNLGIPIDISSAGTINVRISLCFSKSFQFHVFFYLIFKLHFVFIKC